MSIYVPYAWPETAPMNRDIVEILRRDLGAKVTREFNTRWPDRTVTSMVTDADHLTPANVRRIRFMNRELGRDVVLLCRSNAARDALQVTERMGMPGQRPNLASEGHYTVHLVRNIQPLMNNTVLRAALAMHVESQKLLEYIKSDPHERDLQMAMALYPGGQIPSGAEGDERGIVNRSEFLYHFEDQGPPNIVE